MTDRGVPAILVQQVPEHPKSLATCTHSWGVEQGCIDTIRTFSDDRRSTIVSEERVAAQAANAWAVWDPAEALCDATMCRRQHGGVPVYLDKSHVNPSARHVLSEPLREVLSPLLEGSPGGPRADDPADEVHGACEEVPQRRPRHHTRRSTGADARDDIDSPNH